MSNTHPNVSQSAVPDQIAAALNDSAKADFDKVAFAVGLFTLGSVGTVCVFELLRRKNKRVYEPKRKYADTGGPAPPHVGYTLFGWIEPVWSYSESEMLHTSGLDAVVFLRFLRLCCWLTTALGVLQASILIPLDVIYNVKERPKDIGQKSTRLSMLSLAEMSGMFLYVHIGMSYVSCLVALYLIFCNYRHLVGLRWAYFRSDAYQRSFAARTLLLTNVPEQLRSDYALNTMLSSIGLPYPTTGVHIGRHVGALPLLIEEHEQHVRQLECVIAKHLKEPTDKLSEKRPTMRINKTMNIFGGSKDDAIEHLTAEINRLESAIGGWRARIGERRPESYGFASLASVPYAHAAAKALKGRRPYKIEATLAPEPRNILWKNLNLTKLQRLGLNVTGLVTLVFVAIFMAAPLLAVALIAQMASFTDQVHVLKKWQDASSWTFNIVAGVVPPGISVILSFFLPVVFRRIAKYRGERTRSDLDKAVAAQYFAFQVISQFILFSILGILITSIATVATEISEHMSAKEIFTTLRQQTVVLRKQFLNSSNYWLTWLPVRMWQSTFDLAQGYRLLAVWVHKIVLGGRTPRHMRQFARPPNFEYAIQYGEFLFVFAVATAYGCLVPLVMVFTAIAFWVSLGCYKYSLMYVTVSKIESGGQLWRVIVNRLLFCLIFMQVILMCVVSLDDTVSLTDRIVKTALCAPPIALVIAFKYYCARRFDVQYDWYLPDKAEVAQIKLHRGDEQHNRLQRRFGHPALDQELFTPMVHARDRRLLPLIYKDRVEEGATVVVGGRKCEGDEVDGGLKIAAIDEAQLEFDPRVDSDAQSVMTMTTVAPLSRPNFGPPSRQGTSDSLFATKHNAYLAGGDLASNLAGDSQYELHAMYKNHSRDNLVMNGACPGESYGMVGRQTQDFGIMSTASEYSLGTPHSQNVHWHASATNVSASNSVTNSFHADISPIDGLRVGRPYPYVDGSGGDMYPVGRYPATHTAQGMPIPTREGIFQEPTFPHEREASSRGGTIDSLPRQQSDVGQERAAHSAVSSVGRGHDRFGGSRQGGPWPGRAGPNHYV